VLRKKVHHGDLAQVQLFERDRDGLTGMIIAPYCSTDSR